MGIFDDFVREEVPRLEPGDYRVEITDVEETVSKSSGCLLYTSPSPRD